MGSSTNVQLWMLEIAHIYDGLADQEAEAEGGAQIIAEIKRRKH